MNTKSIYDRMYNLKQTGRTLLLFGTPGVLLMGATLVVGEAKSPTAHIVQVSYFALMLVMVTVGVIMLWRTYRMGKALRSTTHLMAGGEGAPTPEDMAAIARRLIERDTGVRVEAGVQK